MSIVVPNLLYISWNSLKPSGNCSLIQEVFTRVIDAFTVFKFSRISISSVCLDLCVVRVSCKPVGSPVTDESMKSEMPCFITLLSWWQMQGIHRYNVGINAWETELPTICGMLASESVTNVNRITFRMKLRKDSAVFDRSQCIVHLLPFLAPLCGNMKRRIDWMEAFHSVPKPERSL